MNTPGALKKRLSSTGPSTPKVSERKPQSPGLVPRSAPTSPLEDATIKFIQNFSDFYDIDAEISRGRFSKVKLARQKFSGDLFAAKFVSKQLLSRNAIEMECEVMFLLHRSPYTCKILQAFEDESCFILVMPNYSKLQMLNFITGTLNGRYTEYIARNFMQQLLAGISFIHSVGILHLDLKPENILVSEETRFVRTFIWLNLRSLYFRKWKLQFLRNHLYIYTSLLRVPETNNKRESQSDHFFSKKN